MFDSTGSSSRWLGGISQRAAAVLLCLAMSSSALAMEKNIDKTFPAKAGGALTLNTDAGSVVVVGADANAVSVHIAMRGAHSALDKFDVEMKSDDAGVTIQGHRTTEAWFDWSWLFGEGLHIVYTLQVPRNYRVNVSTSGGDLEMRNFNGVAVGKTSGGNVQLDSLNGDVDAHTSGGDIHALQLVGMVKLHTSGGNVSVENAHGDVAARTSGGNMRLRGIDGKLYAHTSGGNIDADLLGANRGVDVGTSGGNITLIVPRDFTATLDAHTSGGDVDCDLPVTTIGSQEHRRLQGAINGGGAALNARTSGGDIRIRAR